MAEHLAGRHRALSSVVSDTTINNNRRNPAIASPPCLNSVPLRGCNHVGIVVQSKRSVL